MRAPGEIVRTTLGDAGGLPHAGVYILAYMGRVVYVGKSEDGVGGRLASHRYNALGDALGGWMVLNADHANVRLDVLVPAEDAPAGWLREAEAACVRRFRPLLNEQLNH